MGTDFANHHGMDSQLCRFPFGFAGFSGSVLHGCFFPAGARRVNRHRINLVVFRLSRPRGCATRIFLCAVIGATLGDSFAFFLGTRIHVQRIKSWRDGKGEQAFERTAKLLHKRGTSFIFAARFVPGGRVAVNMCAGATGFPYSRFMRTDLAAVICWVSYGMSIGFASGSILGPINPLLATLVGMVGGVILSLLLDRLVARLQRRFQPGRPDSSEESTGSESEE